MAKRKSVDTEVIEFEGKTLDKAIKEACKHFSVPRDQLEIDIIARGSAGIFGIMSGKARIRASLLSSSMRPQPLPEIAMPKAHPSPPEPPSSLPSPQPPPEGTGSREEGPLKTGHPASTLESATHPARKTVKDAGTSPRPPEGFHERASEILETLFQKASLDASILSARMEENELLLDVTGEDVSLVIGKDGQTLDAFEYILNRMLAREFADAVPVIIDAGGYRTKREEFLAGLAAQKAERAKKTRKTVFINPIGPADRRIVYMALKNDPDVRVRSTGEGLYKKMVITPSKAAKREDPQPPSPSSAPLAKEPPSGA